MVSTDATLRDAFAHALASLDLAALVRDAVRSRTGSTTRWALLAVGKCAATMTAGARDALGGRVSRIVVARPSRSRAFDEDFARDEFVTGHPLPDAVSVRAGEAALSLARSLADDEGLLVLLSGGASAALCAPHEGVPLARLVEATRSLIASGAPIDLINAARAGLDRVKHGRVAAAVPAGRPCCTLIVSDVSGPDDDAVHVVGSAPTVAPRAVDLARRDAARAALPAAAQWIFDAALPIAHPVASDVVLVARPADARDALCKMLESAGYRPHALEAGGTVGDLAEHYGRLARALGPREAWVACGEPTIALPVEHGSGGRAGLLALCMAREIQRIPDAVFLAGATDGVDGEGGLAGAVVNASTWDDAHRRGFDPARAIARCDDAPLHRALGSAIVLAPTGLNLLDLHIVARAPG